MGKTDVSTERVTDVEVLTGSELELYLGTGSLETIQDPEEVARSIVRRILEAETADEVLSPRGEVTHAADVLNKALVLVAVEYRRSDLDEGAGVYALLSMAEAGSGEKLLVSCGSRNVMAQAYRLDRLGALPTGVRIVEAQKATAAGFRPMWLEKVEGDF